MTVEDTNGFLKLILENVEQIHKKVEGLSQRLDDVHENVIVYREKYNALEKTQSRCEQKSHEQHDLLWKKLRDNKIEAVNEAISKVKIWVLGAVLTAIGSAMFIVISTIIKKAN